MFLVCCPLHVYHAALSICVVKSFFDRGHNYIRIQIKPGESFGSFYFTVERTALQAELNQSVLLLNWSQLALIMIWKHDTRDSYMHRNFRQGMRCLKYQQLLAAAKCIMKLFWYLQLSEAAIFQLSEAAILCPLQHQMGGTEQLEADNTGYTDSAGGLVFPCALPGCDV